MRISIDSGVGWIRVSLYSRPRSWACDRTRTEEEWRELLTGSGLRSHELVPTSGPDVIEATLND
jgi:hypothetical protein